MSEVIGSLLSFIGGAITALVVKSAIDEGKRGEVDEKAKTSKAKDQAALDYLRKVAAAKPAAPKPKLKCSDKGAQVLYMGSLSNRVLVACKACDNKWYEMLKEPVSAPRRGPVYKYDYCRRCTRPTPPPTTEPTPAAAPKATAPDTTFGDMAMLTFATTSLIEPTASEPTSREPTPETNSFEGEGGDFSGGGASGEF